MGGGIGVDKKLSPRFASKALALAKQDHADNGEKTTYSVKTWTLEVCNRLKLVELWQRFLFTKYGDVAAKSDAVEKLVNHLCTRVGLLKVQECITQSIPCHGTGHGDSGIPECRVIVQELDRCKAGGLPPPAVQPDVVVTAGGAAPPQEPQEAQTPMSTAEAAAKVIDAASMASDEITRLGLEMAEEDPDDSQRPRGLTQREYELLLKAQRYLEPVSFFDSQEGFKEACTQALSVGRTVCIVDMPTSRKSSISTAIETFAALIEDNDKTRLITTMLGRTDLIHDVGVKLQKALPTWYHVLLAHHVADTFKAAYA